MTRENDHDKSPHMTREEYRRQSKRGHHRVFKRPVDDPQENGSDAIPEASRSSAMTADTGDDGEQEESVGTGQTRAASLQSDKQAVAEEKSQRLSKRLNITIAVLVALIIIVYLILFFMG